MDDPNLDSHQRLAVQIVSLTSPTEKETLRIWIERLLEVRHSNLSAAQKVRQAIALSTRSAVVLSAVKIIARQAKHILWSDRSTKGRLGIGAATLGFAAFGGQSAGIAALGTAVAVPLWVLFGAGAAFLGVLYEEITGKSAMSTHLNSGDESGTTATSDNAKRES